MGIAWVVCQFRNYTRYSSKAAAKAGGSDQTRESISLCKCTSGSIQKDLVAWQFYNALMSFTAGLFSKHITSNWVEKCCLDYAWHLLAFIKVACWCTGWMQWRPDAGGNSQVYFDPESDKAPHWGWSWLERWMAARPWENRLLDQNGFTKEDDHSSKIHHSPESAVVDMPLPLSAAPRTCKGGSLNGSVHTSPTPSMIMQVQKQQGQILRKYDQQSDASTTSRSLHERPALAVLESNVTTGRCRYMAATKSAQAKARSQSTPKQRPPSSEDNEAKRKRLSLPVKSTTVSPTSLKKDAVRFPPPTFRFDRPSSKSGELSMASYAELQRPRFR